ncbi:hypothetical protein CYMTET_5412 [Cymbomonas tetramitiformis]|uniref:Uncharacterized protein n=1 Tax=Cymbomonas tetramitiformis TaxID=36881 RepID=A0AAE0GZL7_9CHLO|nr:hypothetical protein CYMTET_5412 [Cymbomonas tetramitiformis]
MVNAAEKKEEAKKEGDGEEEDASEFESEEEAKKEGDGEEEDDEEDDQEDEIEIHCAQPAAEDPEKKYTTFATNNGFEPQERKQLQAKWCIEVLGHERMYLKNRKQKGTVEEQRNSGCVLYNSMLDKPKVAEVSKAVVTAKSPSSQAKAEGKVTHS